MALAMAVGLGEHPLSALHLVSHSVAHCSGCLFGERGNASPSARGLPAEEMETETVMKVFSALASCQALSC